MRRLVGRSGQYGLDPAGQKAAHYLVRPDGHIGYRAALLTSPACTPASPAGSLAPAP